MAFKIKDGIRIGTVDIFNVQAQLMATTAINPISMTDPTDSTSTSTGALKVSGGVGIAKNLYVGDTVNTNKIDPILDGGAGKIEFGIPNTAGSFLEIVGATPEQYANLIDEVDGAIPNKKYVDDAVAEAQSAAEANANLSLKSDGEGSESVSLKDDDLVIAGGTNITTSLSKVGDVVTLTIDADTDSDQGTGTSDDVTFNSVTTGELDVDNINIDGNTISSTDTNGDINITPDGNGVVVASNLEVSDLDADSGVFTGADGRLLTNAGFAVVPNATEVDITVSGSLEIDNLELNGNTISSTNSNGDIVLDPNGTGAVSVSSSKITNVSTPTVPSDAANKEYVDEVAQGLKARQAAWVLVDTNLDATYDPDGFESGWATLEASANVAFPAVDDVTSETLNVVGARILVTAQTNPAHNGLYVLETVGDGSNPWVLRRCGSCRSSDQIPGSFVFVQQGDVYADTGWVASVADVTDFTIGEDAIEWIQFSGAGNFTAGAGLTLTGTVFSVNVDDDTIEIDGSDNLRVKDGGVTNAKLDNPGFTIDADSGTADQVNLGETLTFVGGTGLSTAVANNEITINGDDATTTTKGIASFSNADFDVTSGVVTIKSDGVTLGTQTTGDYVASVAVTAGTGLSVTGTGEGAAVTVAGIDATTTVKGVASFSDDDFAVSNGAVTIKESGVSNAQLVNDGVTVGSTEIKLGASSTTLAGLTQVDVNNIRLSGNTISSTDSNGNIVLDPNGNGALDVSTSKIINVVDPTNDQDAATKKYVDDTIDTINTLTVGDGTGTESVSLATDTLRTIAAPNLGLTSAVSKDGTNIDLTLTLAQDIRTTASPTFANGTFTGDLDVNGGTIATSSTTFNLVNTNATTVNFAGAASTVNIGNGTSTVAIADDATVGGDLTVTGDLIVNGTTTTVNTQTLQVEDPLINLAKGNTTDAVSIGFYGEHGSTPTKSGFFRSHTNGEWYLFTGVTGDITSGNVISTGGLTLADMNLGTIKTGVWDASTIAVNKGGTGQTSYADGELLIGNSSGNTLSKATLTAGSGIDVTNGNGSITIDSTDTLATVTARGATTATAIEITNSTAATTTTTGALTVTGGIATANNVHVGGEIRDDFVHTSSKTETVSTTSATVVDTFALDTYRSGRYIIQISQGTAYQMSEFRIIHNGTNTFITEYSVLETNGELGDFTAEINGSNVEISVEMNSATSATVKLNRTLVTV